MENNGRVDKHGNTMKATEVNLQKNGDSWDNPLIIFHSESFFPDGSSYKLIDVDSVAAVLEQVGSEGSSLKVPPLTTSAETPATDASIENTSNP